MIGAMRFRDSTVVKDVPMSGLDMLDAIESLHRGFLFVHVPKCGGTSIKEAIGSRLRGHSFYRDYVKYEPEIERLNSFAIVRCPYDRLVSAYEHIRKNEGINGIFNQLVISQCHDFEDFVLNWLNAENISKWIHFVPQKHFLMNDAGELGVKKLFKLEDLSLHWPKVQEIAKVHSAIGVANPSQRKAIDEYYKNKEVIEKVNELYECDFESLGYERRSRW